MFDNWGVDVDCDWLGEEECYENVGGTNLNDVDAPIRRMANALALSYDYSFDATRTWGAWADPVWVTEPEAGCKDVQMRTYTAENWIDVTEEAHDSFSVWWRTSSLMHEARHVQDIFHWEGTGCPRGWGNCDWSWEEATWAGIEDGAYRRGIEFLSDFATKQMQHWSQGARNNAAITANQQLSQHFINHPGFNLWLTPDDELKQFKLSDIDLEVLAPPGRSSTDALRAIYLLISPTYQSNGNTVPTLKGMTLRFRHLDGSSPPLEYNIGVGEPIYDDGPNTVVIDAADAGPEYVLTSVGLKWIPAFAPDGTAAAKQSTWTHAIAARAMPDGSLQNPAQIGPFQLSSILDAEVVAMARSHHVLTGFGLGTSGSHQGFADVSFTDSLHLGPLTPMVGSGNFGFVFPSVERRGCPADHVAVGVLAMGNNATPSPPFVGMFGLLCHHVDAVAYGYEGFDSLVHTSFFDAAVGMIPAGQHNATETQALLNTLSSFSPELSLCEPGQAISGMNVRAGAQVDRIESISCTSLTSPSTSSTQSIGVGGLGGELHELGCRPGEVVDKMLEDSHTRLSGLALGCRTN